MIETFANFLFVALAAYAGVGIVVAVALHAGGLRRIDPAVSGAGWWFRVLITPGLMALWPWMIARWRRSASGPAPGPVHRPLSAGAIRRLHLVLAVALAVVVPMLVVVGIVLRPGAVEPTDKLKIIQASRPGEG